MRIKNLKKVKSLCLFLLIFDDNCQVLDESLQSIGLKDAFADLKEVAKDMKEISVRMQNATLAFQEGQKGQKSKIIQNKKEGNRKACKRFRWNQFKHRKCLGRKGRSPKSNVTSKYVQKLKPAIMCLLCRLERAHMVHQGLQHLRNVHKWQVRKDPP